MHRNAPLTPQGRRRLAVRVLEHGRPVAHVAAEFDLDVVGIVSANTDDWDRYESRQWLNAREWFDGNPDHPRRHEVLATSRAHRESYLRDERGQLGWSVLVAVVNRGG